MRGHVFCFTIRFLTALSFRLLPEQYITLVLVRPKNIPLLGNHRSRGRSQNTKTVDVFPRGHGIGGFPPNISVEFAILAKYLGAFSPELPMPLEALDE